MKRTLVALLVLGLAPLVASAVTITWTIQYVTTIDMTGTGGDITLASDVGAKLQVVGNTLTPTAGYDAANYVNQFAVFAQVSGLDPSQAVALLGANVQVGQVTHGTDPATSTVTWGHNVPVNANGLPGLTGMNSYGPNFMFSDGTFHGKKASVVNKTTGVITWASATDRTIFPDAGATTAKPGDAGASTADLLGLLADLDVFSSVQGSLGTADPLLLGNVFLQWDGTDGAQISVEAGPPTGSSWGVYTNINAGKNLNGAYVTGASGSYALGKPTVQNYLATDATREGQTLTFSVPEPATMALLVMGGITMLARRRRA